MNDLNMLTGPLRVCKDNPRYFATPDNKAIYLTGSHTWACLHERLLPETPIIHDYEASKPKQHPVGMTGAPIQNEALYNSPAEWISPVKKIYRSDPPEADSRKVIILDTDHTGHNDANPKCPWRCFTRGMSFIAMDYYMDARPGSPSVPMPEWDDIRKQMGYVRRYADRMDLNRAVPRSDLASSGFCIADEGRSYLVYLPDGGDVTVTLSGPDETLTAEWFCPVSDDVHPLFRVDASETHFKAPFDGDAVLFLNREI